MKQLTDSHKWKAQHQVEKGTWPRRGGGRCWSEGETGTKQRRGGVGCGWWSTHALSAGGKGGRSSERADYCLT